MSTTALPASLAARPRDPRRGLPIPPVNLHPDEHTGTAAIDFTTINTPISTRLAAERRCSLCGVEMGYWVAFLGAPRAAELLRYSDPPGCPDCMRAAVRLCPFIAISRHRRARADRPGAGVMPASANASKPDSWVLGITRRYRSVFVPEEGFTVYFPAPFRTIETYVYDADGRINPAPANR
ncbi:hypothetical protein GCM10009682_35670 [Luedemannella flava]|uniref:Uncharacterized protein n=1 Tax=Luedemannella flava TaxID=349316 RepID=A0ABP4YE56_9ACTN